MYIYIDWYTFLYQYQRYRWKSNVY